MATREFERHTVRARELFGDFWFNSEPVLISAMRGDIFLIEFWDFTCLNSIRTLPYMKEWHRRYGNHGLRVVGVHTPKFPFGRDPDLVQKAIGQLGIAYPVVMDNDAVIASHYDCWTWPTMVLVDRDGYVRYEAGGETNYLPVERQIQSLILEAAPGEDLPMFMEPVREMDRPGAVHYRISPEIYAGYRRGSIGNVEGYSPESIVRYEDPGIYLDGRFYAVGSWMNGKESMTLEAQPGEEGHIVLDYQAVEVGCVVRPESVNSIEVTVRQDGQYLSDRIKGDSVRIAPDGRSFFAIASPGLYSLVRNTAFGEHVLRLSVTGKGFELFSLSFGAGIIPELISAN